MKNKTSSGKIVILSHFVAFFVICSLQDYREVN